MSLELTLDRIAVALENIAGALRSDAVPSEPAAPPVPTTAPSIAPVPPPTTKGRKKATTQATDPAPSQPAPAATAPAASPPATAPGPVAPVKDPATVAADAIILLANGQVTEPAAESDFTGNRDLAVAILEKYKAKKVSQVAVANLPAVAQEALAAIAQLRAEKSSTSLI